jgi:UDP-N-acetylmuramoylalanine--D-glutamate ligase
VNSVATKFDNWLLSLKDRRVAVLGIGISNTPLIRLLVRAGAKVTACDRRSQQDLGEIVQELSGEGVDLHLGPDYLYGLDFDIIFKTPGMRYDLPPLVEARKKGAVVTSEMEVFFELCPAKIFAVTGSDGKTTTTTLIYEILKKQGFTCHLGGNIGTPLLPVTGQINSGDFAVVELSSFQLQTMTTSADVAVITNLTPNHLDIHRDMDEYVGAKKNIFLYQSKEERLVLNLDNDITRGFAPLAKGKVEYFSMKQPVGNGVFLQDGVIMRARDGKTQDIIKQSDIRLPGRHNVENYMAAIAAVYDYVGKDAIYDVATKFNGVEHRIELVRELGGVRYYNDSIASSPARTMACLNSFNQKVILIAGGYDKKLPFDELGRAITKHVKALVLVGATAGKIEESVKSQAEYDPACLPIVRCQDLRQALKEASHRACEGDVVVLSPACASFDMFKNFEERGQLFKELVNAL